MAAIKTMKRGTVIALSVVGVAVFVLHVFIWLFFLQERHTYGNMQETNMGANLRLVTTIKQELDEFWANHVIALLETDSLNLPDAQLEDHLSGMGEMGGVLDAFRLDFPTHSGWTQNQTVPIDSLFQQLDRRDEDPAKGWLRLGTRTYGRQVRYELAFSPTLKDTVLLLVRYHNTYSPANADQVFGLVVDRNWFFEMMPAYLDSALNDNIPLNFAAIPRPREQWNVDEAPDWWTEDRDPWSSANCTWKQTIGIWNGQDTLWWHGDPSYDLFSKEALANDFPVLYYMGMEEFGFVVYVKAEFLSYTEFRTGQFKKMTVVMISIEVLALLLATLIIIAIRQVNLQARRNRIAMSHLAHAVRTPVTRIRLDLDTLKEGLVASPDEEKSVLAEMDEECQRMERAVESTARSLEQGKLHLHAQREDLGAIVSNVTKSWEKHFSYHKVGFEVEIAEKEYICNADRELIALALDNLLDNSLRHVRKQRSQAVQAGGMVRVNLDRTDGQIRIRVDDSGGGLSQEDRKFIFKPFGHTKGDAGTGATGLGLGLWLVKEIATIHKGSVTVNDNSIGGARFEMLFPCA